MIKEDTQIFIRFLEFCFLFSSSSIGPLILVAKVHISSY